MITHIDWLSLSFDSHAGEGIPFYRLQSAIMTAVSDLPVILQETVIDDHTWTQAGGRAPYSVSYHRDDEGAVIFAHPNLPHALLEISGKGCEQLGSDPRAAELLAAVATRLTRIDIACDMTTEARPDEFTTLRFLGRFKSFSEVVSASGHTVYIGSRSSDRYARVYRYNAPHPRSHLLRCEFVLKAEQAQHTAEAILTDGIDGIAAALGNTFGWEHDAWQPAVSTSAEASAWRPERRKGKTVMWLYAQVIPALVGCLRDGQITLDEFLAAVQEEIDKHDNET